jgi:hypothetical protein
MKYKIHICTFFLAVAISVSFGCSSMRKHLYDIPLNGYVPNAETAIKIAKAVLVNYIGEDGIEGEEPFKAELLNDKVWEVIGTHPEGVFGGAPYMRIRKKDGKIILMMIPK